MEAKKITNKTGRIYYLDVLRVIACVAVIMIHVSAEFITNSPYSVNYWVADILGGISRFAVSVFVMISGSLFLDEGYILTKQKLIKHIKKMGVFFLFWSAFYVLFYQIVKPYITHTEISIGSILKSFIQGSTHLWYVYMLIGLYLITPLLKLWVKKENKRQIEYFILLAVIFSFAIPQITRIGSNFSGIFEPINYVIEKLNLKYLGGYTTYFILGWYINNFGLKRKKLIYSVGVLSLVLTIVLSGFIAASSMQVDIMYEAITVNILFYSVFVFDIVKSKIGNTPIKERRIVDNISKYSLGIYAIHPFFISVGAMALDKFEISSAIISMPILFVVALVLSYIATFVISKIPYIKNLV